MVVRVAMCHHNERCKKKQKEMILVIIIKLLKILLLQSRFIFTINLLKNGAIFLKIVIKMQQKLERNVTLLYVQKYFQYSISVFHTSKISHWSPSRTILFIYFLYYNRLKKYFQLIHLIRAYSTRKAFNRKFLQCKMYTENIE